MGFGNLGPYKIWTLVACLVADLKSSLISRPCAFFCVMQGVGPCHFIDPGFGQSRHALRQPMLLVWLQTSFENKWEFFWLIQKEARGTTEAKQTSRKA